MQIRIVLSLIFFFSLYYQTLAQVDDLDNMQYNWVYEDDYIAEDYRSYGISKTTFANLAILDTIIKVNKVILVGESHHYTSENLNIELSMLQYLNDRHGVNNLIMEYGFAYSYVLNKYLNGDSEIYNTIRKICDNENVGYIKALKALNDSLPFEKKIKVYSIDIEREPKAIFHVLDYLISRHLENQIPEKIGFQIEVIQTFTQSLIDRKRFYHNPKTDNLYENGMNHPFNKAVTMDSIFTNYLNSKNDFKLFLGDDFLAFDALMVSLSEHLTWLKYENLPHQAIYRERKMYENLSGLINEQPNEKFFGQFGSCHTSLNNDNYGCEWFKMSALAKRLNEGTSKQQVLSFKIVYGPYGFEDYLRRYKGVSDTKELNPFKNQNIIAATEGAYKSDFQYTIYNYVDYNHSNDYFHEASEKTYYTYFSAWDITLGQSTFNFNNLNQSLFGGNQFNNVFYQLNIGITIASDHFYQKTYMSKLLDQNISFNNANYRLSGYGFQQNLGFYLNTGNHICFSPYGTFGFQRLNLNIKSDSFTFTPNAAFANIDAAKYIRNALFAGGGLDVRLKISNTIGLVLNTQYNYDLSSKKWKSRKIDKSSPTTPLTNWQVNAGIAFVFE